MIKLNDMLPVLLLIDDNEEILDFLERILQHKYTILRAIEGEQAFKLLETEAVQLIVSDVMMPGMDGFEICKKIKSNLEYSHIPVILLTAKNSLQSKVQGLELGADAYIEKPFSKEHLMAQIASLLANRNSIREFYASSPLVHLRSMAHTKEDEHFLELLNDVICKNIDDIDMHVERLATIMNMSRITLYRKIKAISVLTPQEIINLTRLKKAAELLLDGSYKMYEIADRVGFSSQSNFTRSFQKQFGITPTEYLQSKQNERRS